MTPATRLALLRLDPRAWPAFATTVAAQRRHLGRPLTDAIRVAYRYGPLRRVPRAHR